MSTTTTQWILELIDKITAPMKGITDAAEDAAKGVYDVGDSADNAQKKLKELSAIDLYAISSSIKQLSDDFNSAMQPGVEFDAGMRDIEAITGITGDALEKLGDNARSTAKQFGGDATAMLESYKGILSRLGPDVAKNSEALNQMGVNIATLSKTMGNDAPAAMDALTTSMLQFGVSLDDPEAAAAEMTRMMNIMAAGAKEGAAEVPQISEALKQAGVQALNSKVSFAETNSALQALAQGGKYGSEAGIALRNVLGKMAGLDVIPKEAAEKIRALGINYDIVSDKSLPLTTRLRELSKAQADATLITQIFGTENAAAAGILLRSTEYQDEMTKKITGTNTATEQANIVMSGWGETMGRASAWFKDLGISFFSAAKYVAPFVTGVAGAVTVLANLSNARTGIMALFSALKALPSVSAIWNTGFASMSAACTTLRTAILNIPVIGWILALIAALIALGTYLWKTSATFRGVLFAIWEVTKAVFTGIFSFVKSVANGLLHILKGVFNPKNWFDSNYKFADGFKQITDAAKDIGSSIGNAWSEGMAKGMEHFYKNNPDKDPSKKNQQEETSSDNVAEIPGVSSVITPESLMNNGKSNSSRITGGGNISSSGSSIKSISQKIDIKNYFTVSDGANMDAIAEKLMRAINDRLRDGIVTV